MADKKKAMAVLWAWTVESIPKDGPENKLKRGNSLCFTCHNEQCTCEIDAPYEAEHC